MPELPDSFGKLYAKLLLGERYKLHFSSSQEFCAFRNSLAVCASRQRKLLTLLGMDLDNFKYQLKSSYKDGVAEIYLEKKVLRNFKVVEVESAQLDKQEGAEETIEEIPKYLGKGQS